MVSGLGRGTKGSWLDNESTCHCKCAYHGSTIEIKSLTDLAHRVEAKCQGFGPHQVPSWCAVIAKRARATAEMCVHYLHFDADLSASSVGACAATACGELGMRLLNKHKR